MKVFRTNDNKYTFTPERWVEYFKVNIAAIVVKDLKEGAILPPFYLPVRRPTVIYAYECWILPLAPFVWLIYLFWSIFWKVWYDMQNLIDMLVVFTRKKS